MQKLAMVSPFRCRMWGEHERLEEHITEESCKAEIISFAEHGQRVPVLGRPVKDDPMCDVELVYGARRLFVARYLNVPLKVELHEMTDQEAAAALDIENRQRKEISAYERGQCYARWLRSKMFESQEEIARALRISASQVSRMVKLSRLPSVVVNAFESPLQIREAWGVELYQIWQDPRRQRALSECARLIAKETPRPDPEVVFRRLVTRSVRSRSQRVSNHDQVIAGSDGRPLFRIRFYRRQVAFMLESAQLSRESLAQLTDLMTRALQDERVQVAEKPEIFSRSVKYSNAAHVRAPAAFRHSPPRHAEAVPAVGES